MRRPRRIIWWVSLVIFVFSAAWIASYLYQGYFGAKSIEHLSGAIAVLRATSAPSAQADASVAPTPFGESGASREADAIAPPHSLQQTDDEFLEAYAALARKNPDMAGWVYIEGTTVDYPVMHTPYDPEKYLHRDFEGRYAFAGLPFLDADCDPDADSANLILYAHNMRSGQMFAQLTNYLDPAFRQAHPLISFDTLAKRRVYCVIAVLKLQAVGRQEPSMRCYRQFDTTSQAVVDELNEYLERFASALDGAFELGDDILTLSTCEHASSTDRLVVIARKAADTAYGPYGPTTSVNSIGNNR